MTGYCQFSFNARNQNHQKNFGSIQSVRYCRLSLRKKIRRRCMKQGPKKSNQQLLRSILHQKWSNLIWVSGWTQRRLFYLKDSFDRYHIKKEGKKVPRCIIELDLSISIQAIKSFIIYNPVTSSLVAALQAASLFTSNTSSCKSVQKLSVDTTSRWRHIPIL